MLFLAFLCFYLFDNKPYHPSHAAEKQHNYEIDSKDKIEHGGPIDRNGDGDNGCHSQDREDDHRQKTDEFVFCFEAK